MESSSTFDFWPTEVHLGVLKSTQENVDGTVRTFLVRKQPRERKINIRKCNMGRGQGGFFVLQQINALPNTFDTLLGAISGPNKQLRSQTGDKIWS